jgi:hypothetical protein
MKNLLLLTCLYAFSLKTIAQVLHPSLGLSSQPVSTDNICPWTTYLDPDGTFNTSGLQVGDTATDFTLYEPNGTAHNLMSDLQTGKPVLLISGSYTCPVFHNKVATINNLVSTYGLQVIIYVVYQNEAHPYPDVSPYNTFSMGVASYPYSQHLTYGDRLNVISIMQADANATVNATILVDGPCNEWQMVYGPAPNNSTLIAPTGIVYSKHGWFDKAPSFDIETDIQNLLSVLGVEDKEDAQFSFSISPNPASGNLVNFNFHSTVTENVQIIVNNYLGETISQFNVYTDNTFVWDVSQIPNGLYLCSTTQGGITETRKIIIQK